MIGEKEFQNFQSLFPKLIKVLIKDKDFKDIPATVNYFEKVIQYNVNNGKKIRGILTLLAFKNFTDNGKLSEENLQLANVLGWCVEILHSAFLLADDLMDGSESRRGKPCWFKVEEMGKIAFNDALYLESAVYKILKYFFKGKPCYPELLDTFHDITLKTIMGQSKDTRIGFKKEFENLTMENYMKIVKYKTSFYTFYMPMHLAYVLSEISNENLLEKIKNLCMKLGELFQIQDDYLDCFVDSSITGKIGSDIQEFKYSWLICKAIELANEDQIQILKDNYGSSEDEKIGKVKEIFIQLKIPQLFSQTINSLYEDLILEMESLENSSMKLLFKNLLDILFARKK